MPINFKWRWNVTMGQGYIRSQISLSLSTTVDMSNFYNIIRISL